jgi:predicted metal-dependent HD superfamily phosphohydrolase
MRKNYTDLKPEDVDYILVKTTSGGPWTDDVFFLVFSEGTDSFWEIPQSSHREFLDWIKTFPDVNMEQFMKSMGCTEDRIFILYRGPKHPVLSERNKNSLKKRLLDFLIGNFNGSAENLTEISENIFKSYEENYRHYHNLEHIQHALWELDQIENQNINKKHIELAIWYHDVIYSQSSKTNEADSAQKMKIDLDPLNTSINLHEVYDMILANPYKGKDLSETEKYFWDIDYSILGQRELEYMVYKQNIRLEYNRVPSLIFHFKRKAFLKNLLKRGIYQTQEFKQRYEAQALTNIKSELSKAPYKYIP